MSATNGAGARDRGIGERGGVGFGGSIRSVGQRQNGSDVNSEYEPSTKKQRTAYLDGPPEDEEIAEKKLADARFDPGNYTEVQKFPESMDRDSDLYHSHSRYSTPLIHFCRQGDIKMCRYLLQKGASVHETSKHFGCERFWSPMYAASVNKLAWREENRDVRFDICKLLLKNGAPINLCNDNNFTPLRIWARNIPEKCIEQCKWFILNGALTGDDGNISKNALRRDFVTKSIFRGDVRTDLLSWAHEELQTHRVFQQFLLGTLPLKTSCQTSSAHLTGLSGKAGILEHIGNYVGLARGRDLRLFRQLAPLLDQYISDTPKQDVKDYI